MTSAIGRPPDNTAVLRAASPRAFGLWSQVYDDELSPLLSLEQRFLAQILPDIRGLDVLDAGCGTGRWLELLAAQSPKTLIGVDASPEMLARASLKAAERADLRLGECVAVPVGDSSIDLVLTSFVLSYLDSLEKFAQELDRIVRPGGRVFLTDMHPETASSLNWKRSFRASGAALEIEAHAWRLEWTVQVFHDLGFETRSIIEPSFGESERPIFDRHGKSGVFDSLNGVPAIYLLEMRKVARGTPRPNPPSKAGRRVTGARVALGANESVYGSIAIERGQFGRVSSRPLSASPATDIDLTGYLALPALINAHDHLEFGLFPNLGRGIYQNSAAWATDIHARDARTIELHCGIPKDVRLWWGGIRNLLSGVTTVCHHNPLVPELLDPGFPVRVLARFGWAHSPALDGEVLNKHHASPRDAPFILHAAEGIDLQSAGEIFDLDRIGALDERTVLVHGLALSPEGVSLLNQRGASLVVCPTSNQFLFGRAHSRDLLVSVARVALGSDSPLTAAGDLLDEIGFAHREIGLDPGVLYEMVTSRPVQILHLRNGEGRLRPDSIADCIAVRDGGLTPAETIVGLRSENIELVMLSARVQLASPAIFERLPRALRSGLEPLEVDGLIRWIRAPLDRLFEETERVLGSEIHLGKKQVRHAGNA